MTKYNTIGLKKTPPNGWEYRVIVVIADKDHIHLYHDETHDIRLAERILLGVFAERMNDYDEFPLVGWVYDKYGNLRRQENIWDENI